MVRAYIFLLRPFTLTYPAVAVFSGAIMAAGGLHASAQLLIKIVLGACTASIINGASNVLNQCYDIEIDRINKPFRPLPSKKITSKAAMRYSIFLYVVGLILSYMVQVRFLFIVIIAICFTLFYSVPPIRTKNTAILGNLTLAISRGILPLVAGWTIISPVISPDVLALGVVLGIFVFGANTSKDFADVKGDKCYGAITFPVKYGVERAARMMVPFLILPFLLISIFVSVGWVRATALPLTLLSLWGAYVAFLIVKDPQKIALERNHPSWTHMYLMIFVYVIGSAVAYSIR